MQPSVSVLCVFGRNRLWLCETQYTMFVCSGPLWRGYHSIHSHNSILRELFVRIYIKCDMEFIYSCVFFSLSRSPGRSSSLRFYYGQLLINMQFMFVTLWIALRMTKCTTHLLRGEHRHSDSSLSFDSNTTNERIFLLPCIRAAELHFIYHIYLCLLVLVMTFSQWRYNARFLWFLCGQ